MRRFLTTMVAASLALSPVAIVGVTSGVQTAHADLGWCDECDIALPISVGVTVVVSPVPAPVAAPVLVGPFVPFAPVVGVQP